MNLARLARRGNKEKKAILGRKDQLALSVPKEKKAILGRKVPPARRVNRGSPVLLVGITMAMASLTQMKMPMATANMMPSIVWGHRAPKATPARKDLPAR